MIQRTSELARTLRWWAIVYAVFITPVDFGTLELDEGAMAQLKWVLRAPVWYLPLVVLAPRWSRLGEVFRRPPSSWLLAWGVLAAISPLWALDPTQAISVGLAMAGLILLTAWYVHTEGWYPFAMAATFGMTLFIGGGLAWDLLNGTLVNGVEEGRSIGLSFSPTILGIVAACAIVVSAGPIYWRRRAGQPTTLLWITPAVSVVALVFSETRTAMAAAAIGLVYGAVYRLPARSRILVLGALVVFSVSAVLIAAAFSDPAALGERGDPTSVAGRTSIWPVAFDLFLRQPILGYGWGANNALFIEAARSGRLTFLAGTSHSIVLSSLLSGGVVGFLLLATGVCSALRRRHTVDAWIIAPIIVVLIDGLTEAVVQRPEVLIILLTASLTAIARVPRGPDQALAEQPPTGGAEGRAADLLHGPTDRTARSTAV